MDWIRVIDIAEKHLTENGKNKADLAKILGVRSQYLSDIRSGKSKNPGSDFTLALINKMRFNSKWLETGEGNIFEDESLSRFDEKTHQGREDSDIFKIPLLTKDDAMRFDPDKDIPSDTRKANSGEYPDTIMATIPPRVIEYSTDLRAMIVPDSRMAPIMRGGDVAIIEATGWHENGIYLYRMGGHLHISYVVFNEDEGRFKFENEMKKEIVYDPKTFKAIGRVRAVVRDLFGHDQKGK